MKKASVFSFENLLMSVGGHLIVVALLVTSIVLVGPIERIVAPDRIQIIEMDLANIKITRDETLVYNTAAPKAEPKSQPEQKKTEPKTNEQDWQAEPKKEPVKKTEPKPTETPTPDKAPVQTTTVRVNRETAALNRTMTVSVVDALRMAMTRCWAFDRNRPGIDDIRAVAHMRLNENGMVADLWFEEATRADEDPAFAYILETIRMAIATCQPFRMLPPSEFDAWQKIVLTFYPSNASVQ